LLRSGSFPFAPSPISRPGSILGLYWRRAHRFGVVAGLVGGFVVWLYALLLPTLQARERTGSGLEAAPLKAVSAGPFLADPRSR
jgi:Na+/proline symporter